MNIKQRHEKGDRYFMKNLILCDVIIAPLRYDRMASIIF